MESIEKLTDERDMLKKRKERLKRDKEKESRKKTERAKCPIIQEEFTMFYLQWKNKNSNDTGLVGRIIANDTDMKGFHFISVTSPEDAKKFDTLKEAEETVQRLIDIGEAVNNDFYIRLLA